MRKRMVGMAGLVVLSVLVGVLGAKAGDAIYAFKGAFVDIEITQTAQPCGANGLKGSTSMTVYDSNAFVVFTCNDDRVILRRFLNPNDAGTAPVPVYTVPNPYADSDAHTVLTQDALRAWTSAGVNFNAIESGAPVPGKPGKTFVHNGHGWTIQ